MEKIDKSKIPKVTFKQMPLELETEMFFDFLDRNWSDKITSKYPQFIKIKDIKSRVEREKAIRMEIAKIRKELGDIMASGLRFVEDEWNKVQKEVFETLAEIIQED